MPCRVTFSTRYISRVCERATGFPRSIFNSRFIFRSYILKENLMHYYTLKYNFHSNINRKVREVQGRDKRVRRIALAAGKDHKTNRSRLEPPTNSILLPQQFCTITATVVLLLSAQLYIFLSSEEHKFNFFFLCLTGKPDVDCDKRREYIREMISIVPLHNKWLFLKSKNEWKRKDIVLLSSNKIRSVNK